MDFSVVARLATGWIICSAIGLGTAVFVLPRCWGRERLLLIPTFGAVVVMLLSATLSYAGLTMRQAAPIVAIGGLVLSGIGVAISIRRRDFTFLDWRGAALAHAVGLLAACSVILSVVVYRAWNPYNDAFTYFSIADYLQDHSYFTKAEPGTQFPVLSQMVMYQRHGFRMGSNFFLAFVTGLLRTEYAFDMYIPVLGLGVALGVPGFVVLCRRALFMRATPTAVAVILFGLNIGIVIINALWGFLPQVWGFAFALPWFALSLRATGQSDSRRRIATVGVLAGALVLTYPEIVPLIGAAVVIAYAARVIAGRLALRTVLAAGMGPVVIAGVLAPVAAFLFVGVIRHQAGAVVGWDVGLALSDYIYALPGYASIADQSIRNPGSWHALLRVASIVALGTAIYGLFAAKPIVRRQLASVGGVFIAALVWFGVVATNPFNHTLVGNPWSTYKLVTYGHFLFAALWASGLVALWRKDLVWKTAAAAQLLVFCAYFPLGTAATSKLLLQKMQGYVGHVADPVGEYKRLPRMLETLPRNEPVNLVVSETAGQHKQLVAYFLRRPIIADWSYDHAYIGPFMASMDSAPIDPRFPLLTYAPGAVGTTASMTLRRDLPSVLQTFTTGWYGEEHEGSSWWRWLEERGQIDMSTAKDGWLTITGELAVVGAPARTMTITIVEAPDQNKSYQLTERWFSPFKSERIHLAAGRYHVSVSADGPVRALGPGDDRRARIGVRNLSWMLVPD